MSDGVAPPSAATELIGAVLEGRNGRYQITGPVIGSGAHSVVICAKNIETGREHAAKCVSTATSSASAQLQLSVEVGVLTRLSAIASGVESSDIISPQDAGFVVRMYDFIPTPSFAIMMLDYCDGGDLFDQSNGARVPEALAARLAAASLRAVRALHAAGVCHLDIKPENLVLAPAPDVGPAHVSHPSDRYSLATLAVPRAACVPTAGAGSKPVSQMLSVRLCDLGHVAVQSIQRWRDVWSAGRGPGDAPSNAHRAAVTNNNNNTNNNTNNTNNKPSESGLQCLGGSIEYMAPEVFESAVLASRMSYDGRAADVWSVGVTVYALVTGELPFEEDPSEGRLPITAAHEIDRHLLRGILKGTVNPPAWLSPAARSFLTAALIKDPAVRPSVDELLHHEWLAQCHMPLPPVGAMSDAAPDTAHADTTTNTNTSSAQSAAPISRHSDTHTQPPAPPDDTATGGHAARARVSMSTDGTAHALPHALAPPSPARSARGVSSKGAKAHSDFAGGGAGHRALDKAAGARAGGAHAGGARAGGASGRGGASLFPRRFASLSLAQQQQQQLRSGDEPAGALASPGQLGVPIGMSASSSAGAAGASAGGPPTSGRVPMSQRPAVSTQRSSSAAGANANGAPTGPTRTLRRDPSRSTGGGGGGASGAASTGGDGPRRARHPSVGGGVGASPSAPGASMGGGAARGVAVWQLGASAVGVGLHGSAPGAFSGLGGGAAHGGRAVASVGASHGVASARGHGPDVRLRSASSQGAGPLRSSGPSGGASALPAPSTASGASATAAAVATTTTTTTVAGAAGSGPLRGASDIDGAKGVSGGTPRAHGGDSANDGDDDDGDDGDDCERPTPMAPPLAAPTPSMPASGGVHVADMQGMAAPQHTHTHTHAHSHSMFADHTHTQPMQPLSDHQHITPMHPMQPMQPMSMASPSIQSQMQPNMQSQSGGHRFGDGSTFNPLPLSSSSFNPSDPFAHHGAAPVVPVSAAHSSPRDASGGGSDDERPTADLPPVAPAWSGALSSRGASTARAARDAGGVGGGGVASRGMGTSARGRVTKLSSGAQLLSGASGPLSLNASSPSAPHSKATAAAAAAPAAAALGGSYDMGPSNARVVPRSRTSGPRRSPADASERRPEDSGRRVDYKPSVAIASTSGGASSGGASSGGAPGALAASSSGVSGGAPSKPRGPRALSRSGAAGHSGSNGPRGGDVQGNRSRSTGLNRHALPAGPSPPPSSASPPAAAVASHALASHAAAHSAPHVIPPAPSLPAAHNISSMHSAASHHMMAAHVAQPPLHHPSTQAMSWQPLASGYPAALPSAADALREDNRGLSDPATHRGPMPRAAGRFAEQWSLSDRASGRVDDMLHASHAHHHPSYGADVTPFSAKGNSSSASGVGASARDHVSSAPSGLIASPLGAHSAPLSAWPSEGPFLTPSDVLDGRRREVRSCRGGHVSGASHGDSDSGDERAVPTLPAFLQRTT